jgi:LmbE family N-acetylglucosaminyl deacetylase
MSQDPFARWKARHADWLSYVRDAAKLLEAGKGIALGPSAEPLVAPSAPASERPWRVAVCSPHPDDESLIGALPLRLRLECGAQVTNCAITFGSNLAQRSRRLRELESACRVLGFELAIPREPLGFDNVNLETRTDRPGEWAEKVELLSRCLERLQPDAVFAPHAEDWNKAHIGTHYLAVDALGDYLTRSGRGPLPFIETEFWHENAQPNLMVGVSPEVEATLVMATAEHGGEVSRNPYHLRHPSRMIENVRLGAETVGGQGGAAPDFPFGELYRVTFMKGKQQIPAKPGGRIIGPDERVDWTKVLDQFRPPEL